MIFFCFGIVIVMLGIWIEVGIAQDPPDPSTWMPDAELRTDVLTALQEIDPNLTLTKANMSNTSFTRLQAYPVKDLTGLEYATNLTHLNLRVNNLSDISAVSGLTKLTRLILRENKIRDISAVSDLTKLTNLDITKNNIRDISAVSGLTELTVLQLDSNNIRDISAVSGLTKLEQLYLTSNRIGTIPNLSKLTSLTLLYLTSNRISTTDGLLGLTNLDRLALSNNRITDVNQFLKLSSLSSLTFLDLDNSGHNKLSEVTGRNEDALRNYLWVRPPSIDANRAVTSENYSEDPPIETFPFTIRFSEPVYGFQMEDIIVETELHTGTGTATLEALTPTTEPAQTYIATIRLPPNAAGTVRIIVRAEAAETDGGRIDPAVDRVFPWIAFSTLPEPPWKRRIIQECPVGWVRSDGFAGRNRRVLLYEVNLEIDLQNPVSIYKPIWVAIYVHPNEGLENLDGWKLQVALPYNHHRDYLLTAENSVVVDAEFVDGGFAFIENPEEDPFPMVGIGFTGSPAPGFDYRLYDDMGKRVDFGISCYKRGDIFQVLKDMEDPRVLRQVLLESFDWDAHYLRSEWTVPVPFNAPGAPSLHGVNLVGKWGDLKKQSISE